MPLEFLTTEEIQLITEYCYPGQQCKELSRLGIKFERTRSGKPLVLRQVLIAKFGGSMATNDRYIEPDLGALRQING